jgi:outer membrane immunogenic protein
MRAMILTLAAASAAVLAAQPASAQSFTGPRVEANAGYDVTDTNVNLPGAPDSLEAFRIGAAVGYDFPIGDKFTVGPEIGIGWNVAGNTEFTSGATAARVTGGYDLDVSLRVGAKVAQSTLVYAKAGYASSEYRLETKTGNTVTEIKDDDDGYRLGIGLEQAFGEHVYAKAEYRFTDYGDDVNRHQFLLGAGYRF